MSSQDSVVVLSDDEEEADEYLRIHYQESEEFLDVPLESNKGVLSKDITSMDSRISALIIQMNGSKRMVKLKGEYVKEPKEKWKDVKVYAVLNKEREILGNKAGCIERQYPDLTDNWNTRIKSEVPSVLIEEIQNNNQSRVTRSLTSSSNADSKQTKVKVEARGISTAVQHINHPISSSTVARNNDNSSPDESAVTDVDEYNFDVKKSSSDDDNHARISCLHGEEKFSAEKDSAKSATAEPTNRHLFSAYKSPSLATLKVKLCRGNAKYYDTFNAVVNRFKRTMVAYPNSEFVRLIYWAERSDIMMKKLISYANDVCALCDEDFTLKHFVSQKHADKYHQKFNADPPEVAFILIPEIYKRYLDPYVLADLKIPEFKQLEESSKFLTAGKTFKLVSFKYILINRLLQGTLVMDMKNFSFKKIKFLRKNFNHSSLQTIFKTESFKCDGCNEILENNLHSYILHILSDNHLQNSLNQEEWNNICEAMSLVKRNARDFCVASEINRKRRKQSSNVDIKRQKTS